MKKRSLFLIIFLVHITFMRHCNADQFYNVLRIVDGDTLIIDLNNNDKYDKKPINESCRLIGVSTTELNKMKANLPESGAIDSTNYLKGLIASNDNKVKVVYDSTINKTDSVKRQLVYVYLNNNNCVNELILKSGFGIVYLKYLFNTMARDKYIELTLNAHKNKTGLWADKVIRTYWLSELIKYGVNIDEIK